MDEQPGAWTFQLALKPTPPAAPAPRLRVHVSDGRKAGGNPQSRRFCTHGLFYLSNQGAGHDGHEFSCHESLIWHFDPYTSAYRNPVLDKAGAPLSKEPQPPCHAWVNTVLSRQALYRTGFCVRHVSYSTIQLKTCHVLKSTVFNRESAWIDSTLLALLAHRSCKAEWQTRSLPHVKKCVVLFQYSFWSLIYLLHLKKCHWQICWFRTSANTSALRLIKERHVWKVS